MDALSPARFAPAHDDGLAALVAVFVACLAYRTARSDAKRVLGAMSRRPLLTATVALPVVSLVVVRSEWDHPWMPTLSGALVIDDLYFFSVGAVALMVVVAALAARGLYRWAAAERYRAGLVTGAQMVMLTVLLAVARSLVPTTAQATDAPTEPHAAKALHGDLTAAKDARSWVEGERLSLVAAANYVELARRDAPAPAAAAPPSSSNDDIRACIELLALEAEDVKRNVGAYYRLSDGDAHDVVLDALLNVCNAHPRKQYRNLGAVLQTAASRRAIRWATRRGRQCPVDGEWPSCSPSSDELVRFEDEDRVVDAALCKEDVVTQQVIRLRALEDLSFRQVGERVGLPENLARSSYHNGVGRIRKRLADTCGP
jgi:DNA-directed RNA polymerase specialized sigma24 family protein